MYSVIAVMCVVSACAEYGMAAEVAVTGRKDTFNIEVSNKGTLTAEGGNNNTGSVNPYDLQATHSQTLSKKGLNKLYDDIRNNGINEPIKYVENNGQRYVVDGHHRLIVAKRLGLTEVPIEEVELPFAGYKTIEDLLWFD